MKVLIVTAVFPPEPAVTARTSYQIAQELVSRGHQVQVVAPFPNRPGGKLFPGVKRSLYKRMVREDGLEVTHCFSTLSPISSTSSRFLENISFGITSSLYSLFTSRPDIIYANTWPLFATGLLAIVAGIRKIPFVISIQDVYPESLLSQGRFHPESRLIRNLRALDRWLAKKAQAIIVISEAFARIYRDDRGVDPSRVLLIPNWAESNLIDMSADHLGYRRARHIPEDAFVIAYGGNIGVAAGVETVIESLRYIQDIDDIYLTVAGEGSQLLACRELGNQISSDRIIFISPWQVEETSAFLLAADVLALPTRGDQSLASAPSKLITYLLTGKPILALAKPDSELSNIITRAGCGWIVEPGDPVRLAQEIDRISKIPTSELARMGQAGRNYALMHFSREVCLPRVIQLLEEIGTGKQE